MIGTKLNPILIEIEGLIIEQYGEKPDYSLDAFRAASQIFLSVFLDKLFDRQDELNMTLDDRSEQATAAGLELRELIRKYTNIDTHSLYDMFNNRRN